MTDGRVILDVDFKAYPDSDHWPHPDFKVVNSYYGATATIAGGWGVIDTGNAATNSYAGGKTLWIRPPCVDQFEVFGEFQLDDGTQQCWMNFGWRCTQDWNFTTGANSSDTSNDTDSYFIMGMSRTGWAFKRRLVYSPLTWPDNVKSFSANSLVRFKLRVEGDTQMGKMWLASAAEPKDWDQRLTNADLPRKGWLTLAVGSASGHGVMKVSRLTILEVGDPSMPITSNYGKFTANGDGANKVFTWIHGLDITPGEVGITKLSTAALGEYSVAVTATNITVTYVTAPPVGTGNVVLNWTAKGTPPGT